jgi:pyruvate dehydrogenase E1 component beta subunit
MSDEILMPQLPNREDGRIARWLVGAGQEVAAGDVLAEIETASSTLEIEASGGGRIERILVPAGGRTIPAGTPLAVIGANASAGARPRRGEPPKSEPAREAVASRSIALDRTAGDAGEAEGRISLSYRLALHEALAREMRRDGRVFVIGVGVALNRGAIEVTKGLLDEFGADRVVSVPPCEEAFTGLAIGAAYAGLKPVVSFESWGAALPALAPIVHAAARAEAVSGGLLAPSIVFRGPVGEDSAVGAGADREMTAGLHSIGGLDVVVPSDAASAYALLVTAIRSGRPVAILEPACLYETEGEVPLAGIDAAIGRARVRRQGNTLTMVACGGGVQTALLTAEQLSPQGIDIEVVDLVSLRPLDMGTVLASVCKTGCVLTVEDRWSSGAIGSEVVARVAEEAWPALKSAPLRLSPRGPAGREPAASGFSDRLAPEEVADAVRRLVHGRLKQG